jgi:tRNA A58 N-methylase Trm61
MNSRLHVVGMALVVIAATALATAAGQLAQRPAEEYIDSMERPGRVANLKVDEVVKKLSLKAGDVVADIGSGGGAFSIPMARAIGPNGTLYAVDIDQKKLDYVSDKGQERGGRQRPHRAGRVR